MEPNSPSINYQPSTINPPSSAVAEPGADTASERPHTLLLGLGNDLLCDDAIGLRVAAAIRERLQHVENVSVAETPEMGLALLDLMVGFDELILVDAVQTHQALPGFIHELDSAELKVLPTLSPHFLGVGEVIALGRELGLAVPRRVRIFAVEVEDPFTVSTRMTPTLEASLPGIVERVFQCVLNPQAASAARLAYTCGTPSSRTNSPGASGEITTRRLA